LGANHLHLGCEYPFSRLHIFTKSHIQPHASKPQFDNPWLLREFDQIQFYEVDQAGFDKCYEEFKTGRWRFEIEETIFDPVAYGGFLESIKDETESFLKGRLEASAAVTAEENLLLKAWRETQSQKAVEEVDDFTVESEFVDDWMDHPRLMHLTRWLVKCCCADDIECLEDIGICGGYCERRSNSSNIRSDEDGNW
jgi:hypothetical protein